MLQTIFLPGLWLQEVVLVILSPLPLPRPGSRQVWCGAVAAS